MKTHNKFAVIKVKNEQLLVKEGDSYHVKKISGKPGTKVELEVLLTADANKVAVGMPTVKDAKVAAEIVAQKKGEKIKTVTFKAKSRYRKTKGHRPLVTEIKVTKIS